MSRESQKAPKGILVCSKGFFVRFAGELREEADQCEMGKGIGGGVGGELGEIKRVTASGDKENNDSSALAWDMGSWGEIDGDDKEMH